MSVDQKLTNRLQFDGFLNYVNSRSDNRPNLGYGYENPIYGFNWTGRQANIESMKDYWQEGQEGLQHFDINSTYGLQTLILRCLKTQTASIRIVFFGNASVNYQFFR